MDGAAFPRRKSASYIAGRAFFVPVIAVCLLAGMCGGLIRAGVAIPEAMSAAWLTHAVQAHAFLMISAFMGTVIAIERAVAVKRRAAFAAPLVSALSGLLALAGMLTAAIWLATAAAAAFIAVNVLVVIRQRAAHTILLLIAALAWFIGNLGYATVGSPHATAPWWFAFLVLTISAERLEMTRLMRRRPGASQALYVVVSALLAGCTLFAVSPMWGGVVYGVALAALALWLLCFDIARRTVWTDGLSRYMAVCLLLGYFWLAIAGVSWCATSLGLPLMDAAIHSLALGFVFSMMLGHAPVILPAVARVKLLFGWAFYVPLGLLHGSLIARLLLRHTDVASLAASAVGNALSILLFAGTVGGSAIAWRLKYASSQRHRRHVPTTDS